MMKKFLNKFKASDVFMTFLVIFAILLFLYIFGAIDLTTYLVAHIIALAIDWIILEYADYDE